MESLAHPPSSKSSAPHSPGRAFVVPVGIIILPPRVGHVIEGVWYTEQAAHQIDSLDVLQLLLLWFPALVVVVVVVVVSMYK